MYGFESEYTKKETAKILEIYGPAPKYKISKKTWLAKTPEERMAWLEKNLGSKPENATDAGLVKIVNEPGFEFLPKKLVHDSTGNVEFVLSPVNTIEQWEKEIRLINGRFGTGSMQGMITTPKEAFYKASNLSKKEALDANIGWMAFTHEVDAINALESGVVKLAKDPTIPVVPKFQHEYLGPITAKKQERLNQFLVANTDGLKFEPHNLEKIRTREGSFKYIGSTAYRPDIGGSSRIGFEIRDAHKGTETLIDKMTKNTYYLQEGRDEFRAFKDLKAFDSVKDFEKLSAENQRMLKEVFPGTSLPGVVYNEENLIATEVYRNFAYPERDWNKVIDSFEGLNDTQKTQYKRRIEDAQSNYRDALNEARRKYLTVSGVSDKQKAAVDIQKAIAVFSEEAAIGPLFQSWHAGTMAKKPTWNTHITSVLEEVQPFKAAYAESIWHGTIDERIVQLKEKWPDHITIVDDVTFKTTELGQSKRKVVGISLKGLSNEQEALLLKEYTDAMSKGTVSFPLGEGAGHLHTRLGDKDLDFYFGNNAAVSNYRFPSGNRLEPVVSLTVEEELKLRTHIQVASENGINTLGDSGYQGVASSSTKGTIIDNKPLLATETHNCTSWICTARIGADDKALHEIVGARTGFNVYTNPGWWNAYLTSAARHSEKVPVVVYMERNMSLEKITQKLNEAKATSFEWDFSLH